MPSDEVVPETLVILVDEGPRDLVTELSGFRLTARRFPYDGGLAGTAPIWCISDIMSAAPSCSHTSKHH
jgi:hypothetical protein